MPAMAATGLEVFDRTLQTTNIWLDEIGGAIDGDRHLAWHTLGAVLTALRDRLPVELAAHLGAQLPLLIRGAYYEHFRPAIQPVPLRTADEFLDVVAENLAGARPVDVAEATQVVLAVLGRHVTPEQVDKVKHHLPQRIRALWPEPGALV